MSPEHRIRTVIVGAAGRDFHDFNQLYRNDPTIEVVAFTATQIPGISGRRYPSALAGALYPKGIPIEAVSELARLCDHYQVERVHFAYSDVSYVEVMHTASIALAHGADFFIPAGRTTMVAATIPTICVSAVRTGCGKSQLTRWLAQGLRARGLRPVVVRHPMPYGDLVAQAVQRFANRDDLDRAQCTVEEREEYEPHLAAGTVVYAGVDYARIIERACDEGDVLLWDGGNNDFPFVRPDLHIVLTDPLRAGDEQAFHPGEAVLRCADLIVIAKTDAAAEVDIQEVRHCAKRLNPAALIVRARSPVTLDPSGAVSGKRVLVVEDGPTLTHGGMSYGAGYVAATAAGAAQIVDPRDSAVEATREIYQAYPHLGRVLPAVGYSPEQLTALEQTINASDADIVVSGTPCDLAALISTDRPWVRARYAFADSEYADVERALENFVKAHVSDNAG
ncbi:MAG: putative GTPase [Gammaproteobacteria bacterium]|jgi:predicted GTPase